MNPARGSYEQSLVEADMARKQRLYGPVQPRAVYIPPVKKAVEPPKPRQSRKTPRTYICDRPLSSPVEEIIAQEISAAGVGPKDFFSRTRRQAITQAKHKAAYRLSVHLGMSSPQIAIALGYGDHTSVLHGIKKVHAEVARAERMAKSLSDLEWLASGVASSDEIIAKGYQTEVPVKEIARLTGKTVGAVVGRASRLGLSSTAFANPKEYGRRLSDGQRACWVRRKEQQEAVGA